MLAPATGAWHDIVSASADTTLKYLQVINMSPTDTARVVIAVGTTDESEILAPTGLAVAQTGAIGTTTYEYVVTAVKADGRESGPCAIVKIDATGVDALTTENFHTISWSAVTGAFRYRLYCRVGGENSAIIKAAETDALVYTNKGTMATAAKWPWINMTAVKALLANCDMPPGTGMEAIPRPLPFVAGTKLRVFTTGAISLFACGEV